MDGRPDSTETHTGEPCDICGDMGVLEALSTCSKCNIGREHIYCRQPITDDAPALWLCEACDLPKTSTLDPSATGDQENAHLAGCSKIPKDSRGFGHFKWEKTVRTGKVKYMSAHEAIMLSSGANELAFPSKKNLNFHSSYMPSKFVPSISTRTAIKARVFSPKSSSQSSKANPSFRPAELMPLRHSNIQINSVTKQEAGQMAKDSKENKAHIAFWKEHFHKEKPIDTLKHAVETKSESTKEGKKVNNEAFLSLPLLHFPTIISSGTRIPCGNDCASAGSRNLVVTVLPNAEKCFRGPALDSSWTGGFKIIDSIGCKELNDRFQAHPPSAVRRKVYEFSKKMPEVLQFKMLPRDNVWTEMFEDDYPDEDDIGLYFFSGNSQRSSSFMFLLELIETGDFVLRSYVSGVELLLFSSKHLSSKCQRWNENYFLWGVLRRVKKHKAVCKSLL